MNCSELDQMLCPYLDGEFGPDERLELEGHLATCPACARKVHQESAFRSAFRARAREAAAVPLPEGLRERVQLQMQAEDRRARVRAVMPYAAAAALLAAAGGGYVLRPSARADSGGEVLASNKKQDRVIVLRAPQMRGAHVEDIQLPDEKTDRLAYITYEADAHAPGHAPRHFRLWIFHDERGDVAAPPLRRMMVIPAQGGRNVAIWRDDAIVYQLVTDLTEADIRKMVISDGAGHEIENESMLATPVLRPAVQIQQAGFQR